MKKRIYRIPKPIPVLRSYLTYFFFLLSSTNTESVVSEVKVAWQRAKLVSWHHVEKWLMVSHQLPPLQPSGLWIRSHSYLASFTHMKDSLKNWIQNILLKHFVNAYSLKNFPLLYFFDWFRIFMSCILMSE